MSAITCQPESSVPCAAPCRRAGGFSLIELMVALAVVAILAAIAIPSYSAYVVRGKRAQAKTALLQAAQGMERIYTQSGCYSFPDSPCTGVQVTVPPATQTGDYAITFPALPLAQSYTLQATPCGAVAQGAPTTGCSAGSTFTDPDCGVLTLDNAGAKGALGGAAAAAVVQDCWGR